MTYRIQDLRFFFLGALSCQALISFSAYLSSISVAAGHVSHAPFLASAVFAALVIRRVATIHAGAKRDAILAQIGVAILLADAAGFWLFGSYLIGNLATRSAWWVALVGNITISFALIAVIARVEWREIYRRLLGLWRILIAVAVGRVIAGLIGYALVLAPDTYPLSPAITGFASFSIGASLMTPMAYAAGVLWHFKIADRGTRGEKGLTIAMGIFALLSSAYGIALLQLG